MSLFVEFGKALRRSDMVVPALYMSCFVDQFKNRFGYHWVRMSLFVIRSIASLLYQNLPSSQSSFNYFPLLHYRSLYYTRIVSMNS